MASLVIARVHRRGSFAAWHVSGLQHRSAQFGTSAALGIAGAKLDASASTPRLSPGAWPADPEALWMMEVWESAENHRDYRPGIPGGVGSGALVRLAWPHANLLCLPSAVGGPWDLGDDQVEAAGEDPEAERSNEE